MFERRLAPLVVGSVTVPIFGHRDDLVPQVGNLPDDRLVVVGGLPVEHQIEVAVSEQLLALPDELVVFEAAALELGSRESGIVIASVYVGLGGRNGIGDYPADLPGGLVQRGFVGLWDIGVDDDAFEGDVTRFE